MYYSVYHKATQDNETFTTIETRLTYARLMNLKPNSQHIIYVVAIGEKGESLPSETLVAFTDPALPAFVDVSVCVWVRTIMTQSIQLESICVLMNCVFRFSHRPFNQTWLLKAVQ